MPHEFPHLKLNDIALGVYTRGSGASSEAGPQGDIARRIAEASGLKSGMKKGGKVSSASKRADGCAIKGKTRGTMITMKNGGMC